MRTAAGWRAVAVLVALAGAVGVSAFAAAVAVAAPKQVVEFIQEDPQTGKGGNLNTPHGVAVNSTGAGGVAAGTVYVADGQTARIQRFGPEGGFELAWGRDVVRAGADVDTDLGNVFEICTFAPDCKNGTTGSLGGELNTPHGIAVDQTTGRVYVVDSTGSSAPLRVQAFTAAGQWLWTAGKNVVATGGGGDLPGGPLEVCAVAAQCQAPTAGAAGGEFGPGGAISTSDRGNGIVVSPVINPVTGAGNVVVTDSGNRRVQELTSTGGFVRAFGWDTVIDGSPSDPGNVVAFQVCEVAADCKDGTLAAGVDAGRFAGTSANNTGPNRVAVDSTGAIYTVENRVNLRLQKFTPAGGLDLTPTVVNPDISDGGPALPLTGPSGTPTDVAVGAADEVFVLRSYPVGVGDPPAVVAERRVVELDAAGAFVETHGELTGGEGGLDSVHYLAVDSASGDLYTVDGDGIYILGSTLTDPAVSLGVGGVGVHSAELSGLVNPGGPDTVIGLRTSYRFEYRRFGDLGWTALSADRDAGNGFDNVAVSQALGGLEADTAYEARLVASRPFSPSGPAITAPQQFITQASRPDIDALFATDLTAGSATVNARINPNGQATTYRFEYGPTAAYGTVVPDPDGVAGSATSSAIFSEALVGLAPDTTYHYRVTATSANGTNVSADRTFTTRPATVSPTGREFELVSPPDKLGGGGAGWWYTGPAAHDNTGLAAADGDRYATQSYYGSALADGGFSYGSDWTLGERTPAGWTNKPFFNRPGGFGTAEWTKVVGMSPAAEDLSLMATRSASQIAIFQGQEDVWGQPNQTAATALREWDSDRWEIALPTAPDQVIGAGLPQTTHLALAADGGYAVVAGQVRGVAGPGDPTAVAFSGGPADFIPAGNGNVYVDDVSAGLSDSFPGAGVRSLANVCTGEGAQRTKLPMVDSGGRVVAAECPAALAGRDARPISRRGASTMLAARGVISDDGSRVFFMSPDHVNSDNLQPCLRVGSGPEGTRCPPQLYVRQRNADGSATVRWISESAVADQDASLLSTARLEAATPDGDKVFFRSASPLTEDDPNGGAQEPGGVKTGSPHPESIDLYMYDFPDAPGADPGDGTLTRLSAGPTGASDPNVFFTATVGEDPDNTASVRGFSEDGSRVYFATAAPLDGVAAAQSSTTTVQGGGRAQDATRNLYLYDSALPVGQQWRFIARLPNDTPLGGCAARGLGGNGSDLGAANAAGSVLPGVGVNCVRVSGDGSFVVFSTDGRLTADDPDGGSGDVYGYDAVSDELVRLSAAQGGAVGDTYQCTSGAVCHGQLQVTGFAFPSFNVVEGPSAGLAGVSVFFESASRLSPDDVNDAYDVYEWRDGSLALVSTGAVGAEDALYRGSDRDGRNVYVSTRDRLSWQDHDAVLDVYAARSGPDAGIAEPPPPPTCAVLADGCQGAGAGVVVTAPVTESARESDDVSSGQRKRLVVSGVSRKARIRAARTGVLRVGVRTSAAGPIRVVARAKIGKRVRRVARKSVRARGAGAVTVALRLNRVAKRHLRRGRALKVALRVTSPGARKRTATVGLKRGRS